MKTNWTQPSLSRDFALLSAAILFVLTLLSAWLTYTTYARHNARVQTELQTEAKRIERTLISEMQSANYLLTALGKQVAQDPDLRDLVRLAKSLKSFDSKGNIYSIFSWVSAEQKVVVSSNRGVLEEPVDISDRDYVKKALIEPWKMQIGRPIEGRVSGRWVIPVSMGVTDSTGKFIGTIMISIDIASLTGEINDLVSRDGAHFAILSNLLLPLANTFSDDPKLSEQFSADMLAKIDLQHNGSGFLQSGRTYFGEGVYSYFLAASEVPYVVFVAYDASVSNGALYDTLWSRLFLVLVMAVLLLLLLWLVRTRLISPLMLLSDEVEQVVAGKGAVQLPMAGPVELQTLALQIRRLTDLMSERKRIEDEQRYKLAQLRHLREKSGAELRMNRDWLLAVTKQIQPLLSHVHASAQILRDQLYGAIENRKYRQYIQECFQTTETLMRLNTALAEVTKSAQYLVPMQPAAIKIADAAQQALSHVKMLFAEKQVRVASALPADTFFNMDPLRLQALLTNALALLAAHEFKVGGYLVESFRHETADKISYIVISMREDGTGFNPAHLKASMSEALALDRANTDPLEYQRHVLALVCQKYAELLCAAFVYDDVSRSQSVTVSFLANKFQVEHQPD